jgi:hypothetical protein
MLDPIFEADVARRPHVGLCVVGLPAVALPPSGPGVAAGYRSMGDTAEALLRALDTGEIQGLLLVAPGRSEGAFQLQLRAENRTPDGARLRPVAPCVARATAPTTELMRALAEHGEAVEVVSSVPADAAGVLFYDVLAGLSDQRDTPPIGLLRAPADAAVERLQTAAAACAEAIGRRLGPLPRQV